MREKFQEIAFKADTLKLIAQADTIITEYQRRGFMLTVRQLYYQFVSRDIIPNSMKEYKRLASILNDARIAGLLDWAAIEDRTRNVRRTTTWSSPRSILNAVAYQYKEDPWEKQPYAPEVWIEKDALVGVIESVCTEFRIPYFACRGYASQSELYDAGKRFAAARRMGKVPVILHLGDHDPSGLDMTRDIGARLDMFARGEIEVRRLALNMDQVDQYNPPPNPAKTTDARFANYEAEFGESSWELDALDPDTIQELIRTEVDGLIVGSIWWTSMRNEELRKAQLRKVASNWEDIVLNLETEGDDDEEDDDLGEE